jgi:asparagine synthetase B (glutamine-hydrolysing)
MINLIFSHIKSKVTLNLCLTQSFFSNVKKNQLIFSKSSSDINDINKNWSSYLRIDINENSICIDVDAFSACRIFYAVINGQWYFSDNWDFIKEKVSNEFISENALSFFKKHNYLLFDDTINKNIKKIPANIVLIIEKNNNYYVEKENNKKILEKNKYISNMYRSILQNLKLANTLRMKNRNIKLLASGGIDSTLIALMLLKLKVPFEIHCFISGWISKSDKDAIANLGAFCSTNKIAFHPYEFNKIDEFKLKKFHKIDPNISHTYLLFDEIYQNLKKNDICLVGQGVDSLFSFGPSNNKPISLLARQSIFSKSNFLLFVIQNFINIYFKLELKIPRDNMEKFISFINHTHYFCFFNKKEMPINQYCKSTIERLPFKEINLLKLKQIGFLAGADNAIFHNLDKIYKTTTIFPFLSSKILRMVDGSNNDNLEQIYGKYVVKILFNKLKKSVRNKPGLNLNEIRSNRDSIFFKYF